MFGNFAAQAGIIAGKTQIINASLEWNFNNVLTLNFDPLSNYNDRPRINFWRSDSSALDTRYLQFVSGGLDALYPSPTGKIIQQWGDRRTGKINLDIPINPSQGLIAGIDLFTHTWAKPTFLYPPFEQGWTSGSDTGVPHEIKYQYQFGDNKPSNVIVHIDSTPDCNPVTLPPCSLPEEYIVYEGVNQVGCPVFSCKYLTQIETGSSSSSSVEVNCLNLTGLTISGYAFYRHTFNNRGCNIPEIGILNAKCWNGHVCDRTNFLPRLIFGDGNIITANRQINLNNLGSAPYDRDDQFEFNIPLSTILLTGQSISLNLECKSVNNNCHIGVTYIVMTIKTGNSPTVVFDSCIAPGQLLNIPLSCVSGTTISSSSSSSSSLIGTGVEYGGLYSGLYTNPTWQNGSGLANIGNWFFLSGSGTFRNIENSNLNGRASIGDKSFFFCPSTGNPNNYIDAYFKLKTKLSTGNRIIIDSNYFWNGGFRAIQFMTGIQNDSVFRIEHGGMSDNLSLRTGSNFSITTTGNVYTKAITTEISAVLSGNTGIQTGVLILQKEYNKLNYFFGTTLPIRNPIEQLHIYVGGQKANNLSEQQQYGFFVNNIQIVSNSGVVPLQINYLNLFTSPEVVSLMNTTNQRLNISNWRMVSHDGTQPPVCPELPSTQTFIFPNGTFLNPGETVQIFSDYPIASPPTIGTRQFLWSASSIWNNVGDVLSLYNSNNDLILIYRYGSCL